jgi:hypothetical protein
VVPVDPLAGDGSHLRYLRDAAGMDVSPATAAREGFVMPPPGTGPYMSGPIVYSVGRDGVDDGGSRQVNPKISRPWLSFSIVPSQWRDLVLPLAVNPQYHATPPPPPLPDGNDSEATNAHDGAAESGPTTRPAPTSPSPATGPTSP